MGKRVTVVRGSRFGRWTVLSETDNDGIRRMICCRCDCGAERTVWLHGLRFGTSKSCGCLQREVVTVRNTTHGKSGTRTYQAWKNMRQRCTNTQRPDYRYYGGQGITVCKRWSLYKNFLMDMGPVPIGKVIDRIDNNKGYKPGNCRWVSWLESGRNKKRQTYITAGGKRLPLWQWSKLSGLTSATIVKRLKRGWSEENAVMVPLFIIGGVRKRR